MHAQRSQREVVAFNWPNGCNPEALSDGGRKMTCDDARTTEGSRITATDCDFFYFLTQSQFFERLKRIFPVFIQFNQV